MICARVAAALVFCLASLFASTATAGEEQHPYFPLKLGSTWTYQFPHFNDPGHLSSEIDRVTKANEREHTYEVEKETRIGTLTPIKNVWHYELRAGSVLWVGIPDEALAPIVLRANLTKGMHWKEGGPVNIRECRVVDFVRLKTPSGDYKNVAKLLVEASFVNPRASQEQHFSTTNEYYAPNVGLVRVEIANAKGPAPDGTTGKVWTYQELVSYSEGEGQ